METATRTRFALKKAPEIKAFPALNVRRCAAVWQSPPSACAGWSARIPGSISAGCCRVQRAFRIGRRAVCAAGKCRHRVPCRRAEPPAGSIINGFTQCHACVVQTTTRYAGVHKKLYKKITNRITIRMFKSIVKKKGDFNGK